MSATLTVAALSAAVVALLLHLYRIGRAMALVRRRVEHLMATGEPEGTIATSLPRGQCRELAGRVDDLVTFAVDRCHATEAERARQNEDWRSRYVRQRLGEQYVLRQSSAITDESVALTKLGLSQVVEHAQAVLATTAEIKQQTGAAMQTLRAATAATDRAVRVLDTLEDSFQRVDGITGFITAVAEQTNLLALNAAMEASRAGQAGRGFGVVAQEIKALATETSRSAEGIATLMRSLRRGAGDMTEAMAGVSGRMAEIETASGSVATAVDGQHRTLSELEMCANDVSSQMELLVLLADDVDRRRHPRVAITGLVTLRSGGHEVRGDLMDLSEGGLQCKIEKAAGAAVGDAVSVQFGADVELPPVAAVVVWRHGEEKRDRVGLEFQDLAGGQRDMIRGWLTELLPTATD